MTMLNFAPRNSVIAPSIRRAAGSFFRRLGRLINRWIAAEIARRERQAAIVALRQLSDRELKDIGLTRGEIGVGLAEAASMCGNGGEARQRTCGDCTAMSVSCQIRKWTAGLSDDERT